MTAKVKLGRTREEKLVLQFTVLGGASLAIAVFGNPAYMGIPLVFLLINVLAYLLTSDMQKGKK